jgi:hypothetical protein
MPVGATPLTADLLNAAGPPVITALAVVLQPNTISIASNAVNPGGQLGIHGGARDRRRDFRHIGLAQIIRHLRERRTTLRGLTLDFFELHAPRP